MLYRRCRRCRGRRLASVVANMQAIDLNDQQVELDKSDAIPLASRSTE
jgi:hypothetical protein